MVTVFLFQWNMWQDMHPIALRTAKTLWSFGRSECKRVKLHNAYFIVVFFHKAAESQPKPFVWPNTPVHTVHTPWSFIFIDLLPLGRPRGLRLGRWQTAHIYRITAEKKTEQRHFNLYLFLVVWLDLDICIPVIFSSWPSWIDSLQGLATDQKITNSPFTLFNYIQVLKSPI